MAIYITKGSKGELVKKIQGALHITQDGVFGSKTEETIKDFQKKNGLKVDGIVGDKTWNAIFSKNSIFDFTTNKTYKKKNKKEK